MSLARSSSLVALALALAFAAGCGGASKDMAPRSPAAPGEPSAQGAEGPAMEAAADSAPAAHVASAAAPPVGASGATAKAAIGPQPPAPAQAYAQPSTAPIAESAPEPTGTEHYQDYGVNPFVETAKDRVSTFSIDVDTASYSIARRKLNEGTLPPFAAVRAEEFLNSFDYGYPGPSANDHAPFHVELAAAPSPFTKGHHLVRVGIQAKRISPAERTPVHLVYLVDVSGSMSSPDKLPLAKRSLKMLTDKLRPGDTVALCTYAGHVSEVLPPTGVEKKAQILRAIDGLESGGSTAMSSGIQLAYDLASRTLVKGQVNRVVVLSDGDANVGNTSHQQVLDMIAKYKDKGITLSTVGFGSGNYKDVMMEQLADKGDGNYSYIDSEAQAKKVFVEQTDGVLQVVARDVKIQVDFDPNVVRRYRLVGYENRDVADKDFRNDKVDAGEVGGGHSVTALYDVELARTDASPLTVRLRYKPAKNALNGGSDKATETAVAMPARAIARSFDAAPESLRFATAVAGFAEILRHSPAANEWRLDDVARIAAASAEGRPDREELVKLVAKASALSGGAGAPIAR